MKKKNGFVLFIMVMSLIVIFSGCSKKGDPAPSAPAQVEEEENTGESENAMSEKVTIRFMENGWVNTPTDKEDPWRKWINETYNVDFNLTAIAEGDFESKLLVQFASNEPPDMIFAGNKNTVKKLYSQGVLMEDWTSYLDKLPTLAKSFTDQSKAYTTLNGKMIGIPTIPDTNLFSWMIRKDWLANLGLKPPTNEAELLEVLKQFTLNDPDKNGANDTWGISSAGTGINVGEIIKLEGMYGQTGISVKAGNVEHSITNGVHKQFLVFLKKVVKEKWIDPDWYSQGWAQRAPKLYDGRVGMVWYPGVLVQESEGATGNTGKTVDWFASLPMPKATEDGGKRAPTNIANGIITVSAAAAKDPVKMDRILKIIEESTYPNAGFWALRWGVGVNGQVVKDVEGGAKFINLEGEAYRATNLGAWDWGTWISTWSDRVLESHNPEPGKSDFKQLELDNTNVEMPSYPNYMDLLNIDPQIMSDLDKITNEFDIKYVLGEASDYDSFMEVWLNSGGQKLIDEAATQLKELNMLK